MRHLDRASEAQADASAWERISAQRSAKSKSLRPSITGRGLASHRLAQDGNKIPCRTLL